MIKFVNNAELLKEAVNPKAFTNVLDSFLSEALRNSGGAAVYPAFKPAADISENEKQFELRLALPGYSKEQIGLELKDNRLTVSNRIASGNNNNNNNEAEQVENIASQSTDTAESAGQEKMQRYHVKEIYSGNFSRTFKLPETADKSSIGAELKDGILFITIAKTDPKAGVTFIEVK